MPFFNAFFGSFALILEITFYLISLALIIGAVMTFLPTINQTMSLNSIQFENERRSLASSFGFFIFFMMMVIILIAGATLVFERMIPFLR
jgi:hypothetical protein